ncbi:hypothetical protein [Aurantimonas sp. A3-2-R12]|uniref:hypothetical protein n=1 Tax=Aurantimonas sp. A3-2-R12 TaxID=3114362 RepID=UPI002E1953C0|nr:hypothetical protein [Aurantimonas sp. A3-2-R12]
MPAILSLVGALIGASLSGWLAYRKSLSERWWDRKYQAYAETLEALNSIREDLEASFDAHLLNQELDEEHQTELRKAYVHGRRSVEKQRSIGGLVISDEAIMALKKFEESLTQAAGASDYFSYLDGSLFATSQAISSVLSEGRRELRAKND